MNKPVVWTIAGSDSSAGAGIQADLLTFHHFNMTGSTIITATTAQTAHGIQDIHFIPSNHIQSQLITLANQQIPAAIKIGMLGNANAITILTDFLKSYSGYAVLDPVLISTSGNKLYHGDAADYLKSMIKLFPFINIFTPNLSEAGLFLERKIFSYHDIENAAHVFISMGVKNIVIKGGHFDDIHQSQDYWTDGRDSFWMSSPRQTPKNYRGSGCVFSSAIAAALASGYTIMDALVIAKMYVQRGIRLANMSDDYAHLHHAGWPEDAIDLPRISTSPCFADPHPFADCGPEPIGLYPVVDSSDWVAKLLPHGVKTIQLRIKNKNGIELENEIKRSVMLARQHDARLFVNDFWELAITHGAYGVHLGQEDLLTADIKSIRAAGLRLGVSTHCFHEVARAHSFHPSYIACGPIFETNSKVMLFKPQGIKNLSYWRQLLLQYPLVAIGGIDVKQMHDVMQTGVDGVALISAITCAEDPIQKIQQLLQLMSRSQ